MSAKPWARWVGGKRQLLPQLLALAPKQFETYHEPFLGGGAMFFALKPTSAILSDTNPRLLNVYRRLRDNFTEVVEQLRTYERDEKRFYAERDKMNAESLFSLNVEAAARFVYINKCCFNGLYRENSDGKFNVPYGGDKKGKLFDEANLLECSLALRAARATIQCVDFAWTCSARAGDFVYFDPPYVPLGTTSFVDYTSNGFGVTEQTKLRDLARDLKQKGVHVLLSNSDTPVTRELYAEFELHEVRARRSINSDGAGRGKIGELIIR